MSKEQIKKQIREALDNEPLKADIKKAALFGSYLHETPSPDSDVDVLVEFTPHAKIGLFELIGIQQRLEDRVGKKVDLLTPEALSKYFRDQVVKEAETIYER